MLENLEVRRVLAVDVGPLQSSGPNPDAETVSTLQILQDDTLHFDSLDSLKLRPAIPSSGDRLALPSEEQGNEPSSELINAEAVVNASATSITTALGLPNPNSDASSLQSAVQTVGNDLSSNEARAAAWLDFDDRAIGAADLAAVDHLRRLSLNPSQLDSQLIGLHTLELAENPFGENVAMPTSATSLDTRQLAIGAFCNADGSHSTPNNQLVAEGEAEEGGGLNIPDVNIPALTIANPSGLDAFRPPNPASSHNTTTHGQFDNNTTPDVDLTLPGLNWFHDVSTIWNGASSWSVNETLILSFNLSESVPIPSDDSASESDDGQDATDLTTGPDISSNSSANIRVERSGFIILVAHADMGISAPAAAGVTWSVNVSFNDTIGIFLDAGGGTSITPNLAFIDRDASSGTGEEAGEFGGYPDDYGDSNPGDFDGNYPDDYGGSGGDSNPPGVPADTSGSSTWHLNIGIIAWSNGSFGASSSPVLVGGGTDIDTDVELTTSSQLGGKLILGGGWQASSSSGDINDPSTQPDFPAQPGDDQPIDNVGGGGGDDIEVPSDGVLPSAIGDRIVGTPGISPLPEPQGAGHEFGSSGGFDTDLSTTRRSGLSLKSRVRNSEQLTSIEGSLKSGFENKFGDSFRDNQVLVFSDGGVQGNTTWTGSIVSGKNVSPHVTANMGNDIEYTLGLEAAEVIANMSEDTQHYSASGGDTGVSFEHMNIAAVAYAPSLLGFAYDKNTLAKGQGNAGSSSGAVTSQAELNGDTGKLELAWGGTSYERNANSSDWMTSFQVPGGHEKYYGKESNAWSHTFTSDGDITNTLGSSGDVDSDGGGGSESIETLSYSSHTGGIADVSDEWGRRKDDGDRYASYTKTITTGGALDSGAESNPDPTVTVSGDDTVQVTGHSFADFWGFEADGSIGYHDFDHIDVATGSGPCQGEGQNDLQFCSPGSSYDPRNDFERLLDGTINTLPSGDDGGDDDGSIGVLPPDYVYPSVDLGDDTWMSVIAGQQGDGIDQAFNYTAGLGDNLSMGLGKAIRTRTGMDRIDYESGAYIWGDRTGTAISVATMGVGAAKGIHKLANSFDDLGRCKNVVTKLWHGGCFVPGTLVTLSDSPRGDDLESQLWSTDDLSNSALASDLGWLESGQAEGHAVLTAARSTLQIPIEDIPLGARVPTKNPKPWEIDDSLPEPDEASWVVVSFTVERSDGGIVDAVLLRPKSWVQRQGIQAGTLLPMHIEELKIEGAAFVNSITASPRISQGEGSAVTGRFITRQVDQIARAQVLSADGQTETLEGTTIHPIWSLDRDDWVELGELDAGEQLSGQAGPATVLSLTILNQPTAVYNIEVHGQHVYQVGGLGVLVHNACEDEAFELATGQVAGGFMSRGGELIGKLFTNTSGGHAEAVLRVSGLTARLRNGSAFAFSVGKRMNGTIDVFPSGTFPIPGGLTSTMRDMVLKYVR